MILILDVDMSVGKSVLPSTVSLGLLDVDTVCSSCVLQMIEHLP